MENKELGVIVLSAEEQLAWWEALNEPSTITPAQKWLRDLIRGEDE